MPKLKTNRASIATLIATRLSDQIAFLAEASAFDALLITAWEIHRDDAYSSEGELRQYADKHRSGTITQPLPVQTNSS